MRIASLLPALTELTAALGHADDLVGISHECDYPPEITDRPRLVSSRIEFSMTAAEVHDHVSRDCPVGFHVKVGLLTNLKPDLILTQSQCEVCAVPEATVRSIAQEMPVPPRILAVNPTSLNGVFTMFRVVAQVLGADAMIRADQLVDHFDSTAREIATRVANLPRPRVLFLEWPDPPFNAGHWIPELITLAGGFPVLGIPGQPSRQVSWSEIAESYPEVAVLAPCGFTLAQGRHEASLLDANPAWRSLPALHSGRLTLADGNHYFSRPGPRLESSLRILAAAIHPALCADLAAKIPHWSPITI